MNMKMCYKKRNFLNANYTSNCIRHSPSQHRLQLPQLDCFLSIVTETLTIPTKSAAAVEPSPSCPSAPSHSQRLVAASQDTKCFIMTS